MSNLEAIKTNSQTFKMIPWHEMLKKGVDKLSCLLNNFGKYRFSFWKKQVFYQNFELL